MCKLIILESQRSIRIILLNRMVLLLISRIYDVGVTRDPYLNFF